MSAPEPPEHVLRFDRVTKHFGTVVANDAVSLDLRPGEVLGVFGHNGAGKTTLLSQTVGLLRPDSGGITVAGIDAVADPAAARRRVAVQPQSHVPLDGLTPRQAVEIAGRFRGLTPRDARRSAAALADELDLGPWLDRRALPEGRGLSGGIRRLTGFAMAIAAPTPVLVLDEPTNDIDASRRRLLWEAVRRRGDDGCGVLLVTHNVVEAERVIDTLVVLDRGRVVGQGTPAQLRGGRADELRLDLELADPRVAEAVPVPSQGSSVRGRTLTITLAEADAATAVHWATGLHREQRIEGFSLAARTLEDAYLDLLADPTEMPECDHV